MDSETKSVGPLALLRAVDWVSRVRTESGRQSHFYLDRTLATGEIKAIHKDTDKAVYLSLSQFESGEWFIISRNPHPQATVLGAYNKPVTK